MKTAHDTKPKLLVILGPTAVGKSDLAVQLAREFNGEIISADSRQVYKGLDIGTGKITPEEMRGIPHHLLDIADPHEQFSVVEYVKLAENAISDILAKGKLPIVCGGTGFYIHALVDGVTLPEVPANAEVRAELDKKELSELITELEQRDSERLEDMRMTGDDKNKRRVMRAIEIARVLGTVPKFTRTNDSLPHSHASKYDVFLIGAKADPEVLKERIRVRLRKRIDAGMIEEAEKLHSAPPIGVNLSWNRMEGLGLEYRYLARYLQGHMTKEQMIEKLGTEIWRYAKRQITWFKRDERIMWFAASNIDAIENKIHIFLN